MELSSLKVMIFGMYVLFWSPAITTATLQRNILAPEWIGKFTDEEQTGVPKHVLAMQDRYFYPVRQMIQKMLISPSRQNRARKNRKTQKAILKSTEFPCDRNGTRSLTRPTSVHQLRPGDIDIIGSVGDSLTVGLGSFSNNIFEILVEHRGVSWTAGGDGTWREYLTLPNILKVFNPKLFGYAYGDSLAEERGSQFNVGENGALSQDLFFMTREVVKRVKNDKRVNLTEHWKLITIMMGSNTFCLQLCYEDNTKLIKIHKDKLYNSIAHIKSNLPRTMVNIVMSPHLELITNFTRKPMFCEFFNIMECPCLFARQYKNRLPEFVKTMYLFQQVEKEIVQMEEFKNTEDFTVTLQTFTEHLVFPLTRFNHTDYSYLSADCFHFSQKGYARAANALWNNIMEPVGRKSTNWIQEFDRFNCPTAESPFIPTWKNSETI
ncbi:phospholipase B1, membrane-associated-like [Adelges cooleyi]|uniref:phospholipase B1, membrane-associated-like n=1 Tax=Adelges cooleyi TaxID=133065 RepID=UPI00218029D6|nr:phospholipase B1, membrane-associated-like [Adelges cooleyi]